MNLADACPTCHPGDHPGSLPLTARQFGPVTLASYMCRQRHNWVTTWGADGWPINRSST